MDNFVQFLLDYYIWFLVVLLIIIITIIGFLVDSKQKRKKKEQELSSSTNAEVKTVEPLPEDIKNPVEENSIQNVNVKETMPTLETNLQNNNIETEKNIKDDINQNIALSEQKPHFEPREVPIPNNVNNNYVQNNKPFTPQPLSPVYINQPINSSFQQGQEMPQMNNNYSQNVKPVQNNYSQNMYSTQNNVNGQLNNQFMNNQQPMYQNNQVYNTNNMMRNNQTIPNQMPNFYNQQTVSPIPNSTSVQNVSTLVQSTNQNVNTNSNSNSTIPNIGINFVTGDTNNNDSWNL